MAVILNNPRVKISVMKDTDINMTKITLFIFNRMLFVGPFHEQYGRGEFSVYVMWLIGGGRLFTK